MKEYPRKSIWSRDFILINVFATFSWISLNMVNATIAPYAVFLNMSTSIAGFISGSYFIFSFMTRPFAGILGTQLNRRTLLFWVSAIWSVLILFLSFNSGIATVLILRALMGAGYSIVSTVQMTVAADLLPEDRMGEGIGYFGLCIVISQIIGPAIALTMAAAFGYRLMFLLSFLFRLFATIAILALPSNQPASGSLASIRMRFSFSDVIAKESLVPTIVGMLFSILNSCLTAFLALYAVFYNTGSAAYFFTVSALFMFASRSISSRWADKRSLASTALSSGLCLILTMLLLGIGKTQYYMIIAGALFGVGYGTLLPITQSKSIKALPVERRNSGSNTYFIWIDTGFAIGNFLGGNIAGLIGFANMYLCLIIPAFLAILLAWRKGGEV